MRGAAVRRRGMRILFATTRAAGHFGPLIPFALACRRAGHDVIVAAAGSLAPHVERAGLPHATLQDPSQEVLDRSGSACAGWSRATPIVP